MSGHLWKWFLAILSVMVLLPFAVVNLARSDAGMALCMILFYGVNPLFSAAVGFFAGKRPRKAWYLPCVSALAFLLSAWALFDRGERAFLIYAGVYLALGSASMLISAWARHGRAA